MKKLVLLTTIFIAGSANAGFLDGISKVLNTTGSILSAVTGTGATSTASTTQNSQGTTYDLDIYKNIPNLKTYSLPNKETSDYKIEDLIVYLKKPSGDKRVVIVATGKFYNKSNTTLTPTIEIPVYDSQDFSSSKIHISTFAPAKEKVKIQYFDDTHLLNESYKLAIDKIKYDVCKGNNCSVPMSR